jgi:uncharacterized protein (DUF1499 family)
LLLFACSTRPNCSRTHVKNSILHAANLPYSTREQVPNKQQM